jgi:hypothetical protein
LLAAAAGQVGQYRNVDQGLEAQWGAIYASTIDHDLARDARQEGFAATR